MVMSRRLGCQWLPRPVQSGQMEVVPEVQQTLQGSLMWPPRKPAPPQAAQGTSSWRRPKAPQRAQRSQRRCGRVSTPPSARRSAATRRVEWRSSPRTGGMVEVAEGSKPGPELEVEVEEARRLGPEEGAVREREGPRPRRESYSRRRAGSERTS